MTTGALAFFTLGGRLLLLNGNIEDTPVSLVHTIKGLLPSFHHHNYIFYYVRHSLSSGHIYLPRSTALTVMLACSAEFKGNLFGILYAFLATIIFVTQNIYSKKKNEAALAEASVEFKHGS